MFLAKIAKKTEALPWHDCLGVLAAWRLGERLPSVLRRSRQQSGDKGLILFLGGISTTIPRKFP
jgi:hypothetical protein